MENHLLSGNNGTLEYKTSLPISPGKEFTHQFQHMLVEDDYTRVRYVCWLIGFAIFIRKELHFPNMVAVASQLYSSLL